MTQEQMTKIKYADQQKDGSFKWFVVFGDVAPWDADESMCVQCASEVDAEKLIQILQ